MRSRFKHIVLSLPAVLLIILPACQKEMINPYDAECPPDIWTPADLTAEQIEEGIEISWFQDEEQIDGYWLEVKADSLEWLAVVEQLIVPDEQYYVDTLKYYGKTIQYRMHAKAGANKSNYTLSNSLEVPALKATVLTLPVTDIDIDAASLNGTITDDGGAPVTERGFCYSLEPEVDLDDEKIVMGVGLGSFQFTMENLPPGLAYYVRAYAINEAGIAYGEELRFMTNITLPEVVTKDASDVSDQSAQLNGEVIFDGGAPIIERGFFYSLNPEVEVNSHKIQSEEGMGEFAGQMIGLDPGVEYYFRAYVINAAGMSLGEIFSFTSGVRLAKVSTGDADNIGSEGATLHGEVTENGGLPILGRGFYFSTDPGVSNNDSQLKSMPGLGNYSVEVSNLSPGTTYYALAYATNAEGTAYGREISFTTLAVKPAISTNEAGNIEAESATLNGRVTYDGGAEITERGFYYDTEAGVIEEDTKVKSGSGMGEFHEELTGLIPGQVYYYVAYAVNSAGITLGEEFSFKTDAVLPMVNTNDVNEITSDAARLNGEVSYNGGSVVTARGFYFGDAQNVQINGSVINAGNGTGTFMHQLDDLLPGTTYYCQAFASNEVGTSFGEEKSFTTKIRLPDVLTLEPTIIGWDSIYIEGEVLDNGGASVTERGFCYALHPGVSMEDEVVFSDAGMGEFGEYIKGLEEKTSYHIRAFAVNSGGTAYGEEFMITTIGPCDILGIFSDERDGKEYRMVEIGEQIWMADNLAWLPGVDHPSESSQEVSKYYVYDYFGDDVEEAKNTENYQKYGVLYNWTASRLACPDGWSLPTDDDWKELERFVGMTKSQADEGSTWRGTDEGRQLKNSEGWLNNGNGTNEHCFIAMPGGFLQSQGFFDEVGSTGVWWTKTQITVNSGYAIRRIMKHDHDDIYRGKFPIQNGYSVRCIKD